MSEIYNLVYRNFDEDFGEGMGSAVVLWWVGVSE